MAEEDIHILKQELITVTEKLEEMKRMSRELDDMKIEIKGLKLFMGRVYPDFNSQLPDIIKKITHSKA